MQGTTNKGSKRGAELYTLNYFYALGFLTIAIWNYSILVAHRSNTLRRALFLNTTKRTCNRADCSISDSALNKTPSTNWKWNQHFIGSSIRFFFLCTIAFEYISIKIILPERKTPLQTETKANGINSVLFCSYRTVFNSKPTRSILNEKVQTLYRTFNS